MKGTVVVVLFGEHRSADVRLARRNWIVAWHDMDLRSRVPLAMATSPREAAINAATSLEGKKWGAFLAARINELRAVDGGLGTELARWVVAKVDGVPFDRHSNESAAKVHRRAVAALETPAMPTPPPVVSSGELDDCEECDGPHVGMIHGISPAERSELLPMLLRDMSDRMDSVAALMVEHGRDRWDGECIDHANELRGAAAIARGWADVISDRVGLACAVCEGSRTLAGSECGFCDGTGTEQPQPMGEES